MPRKEQGWITFQTSEEERHLLEEICQNSQRTKTEVLRELLRGLKSPVSPTPIPSTSVAPESTQSAETHPETPQGKFLKVSSRNVLQGRIQRVVSGAVNSEITLEITHPVVLTSMITKVSAEELGLAVGKEAYAVIKASDIVIAME